MADGSIKGRLVKASPLVDQKCFEFVNVGYSELEPSADVMVSAVARRSILVGGGDVAARPKEFFLKISEKLSFYPQNCVMTFFSHRKLQQNNYAPTNYRRRVDKLSAAACRSTKVGSGSAHKLSAAARPAHGSILSVYWILEINIMWRPLSNNWWTKSEQSNCYYLGVMWKFSTFVFNKVVRWYESGEVENVYISIIAYNFSYFFLYLQKITKIDWSLTKFW